MQICSNSIGRYRKEGHLARPSFKSIGRHAAVCRIYILAFSGLILFSAGCSFTDKASLRDELVNSGPITIDQKNPFVVGNQFLQSEEKKSEILRKFVEFRGRPSAVEVRKRYFGQWKIYMFYLDRREAYLLDESADDWIVRGPEKIPNDILATLRSSTVSNGTAFEKASDDKESELGQPLAEAAEGDLLEQESLPSLRATEKKLKPLRSEMKELPARKTSVKSPPAPGIFENEPEPEIPEPSGALAGLEEVAPNLHEAPSGDMIHTVTFPGETLRIITAWYTGDVNSASRLARINGISNPDRLAIGQTIRIPRYMLANTSPFPEAEIARYNENLKQH